MSALSVTASAGIVECEISVMRAGGRPVVYCDVQHFMRSGLTAAELFANVRPQLALAIRRAAASEPGGPPVQRPVAVAVDVGNADPSVQLVVNDVAACMEDMEGSLGKLLTILARVIAAERAGVAV